MKRKPNPKYATPEELASFAAIQIRSNLRQQAQIRALRALITEHMVESLSAKEGLSADQAAAKRTEFMDAVSSELDRVERVIHQRLLEQAEDESPETAALLDSRDVGDIELDE